MKQKNIEKQIRIAIITSVITICIRIMALGVVAVVLHGGEMGILLTVLLWMVLAGIVIHILFMPYLTWVRIKELREGELYEASQY